jgi:hypothetical protein
MLRRISGRVKVLESGAYGAGGTCGMVRRSGEITGARNHARAARAAGNLHLP